MNEQETERHIREAAIALSLTCWLLMLRQTGAQVTCPCTVSKEHKRKESAEAFVLYLPKLTTAPRPKARLPLILPVVGQKSRPVVEGGIENMRTFNPPFLTVGPGWVP